jgi:hypothetical protein
MIIFSGVLTIETVGSEVLCALPLRESPQAISVCDS